MPTILSLCDLTGNWSRPYREAGYNVIQVDLERGEDVRLLRHLGEPVHGILVAPPCTHFSRAGAWMWQEKGDAALLEGIAIVDACLRAVAIYRPTWWGLENPIGRLQDYLGPPAFRFDPCDFGDPYTKRTWLWGHFTPPVCPILGTGPQGRHGGTGGYARKSGSDNGSRVQATSQEISNARRICSSLLRGQPITGKLCKARLVGGVVWPYKRERGLPLRPGIKTRRSA